MQDTTILLTDFINKRDRYNQELQTAKQERGQAASKMKPIPSQQFQATYSKPQKYKEPFGFLLFPLGLNFMLFLGLNESIGISLRNAQSSQIPFLVLSFTVAFFATFGIKKLMSMAAEHDYKHLVTLDRDNFAWWLKLAKGSGSLYLGLFFIALETAFGLPGLIGLLPPNLAGNPLFLCATIAGGSLFAVANISLGFFVGIKQAAADAAIKTYEQNFYEIQQSDREQECLAYNTIYANTVANCDAIISHLQQEIAWIDLQIAKLEWELRPQTSQSSANKSVFQPSDPPHQASHVKNGNSQALNSL
jgi:hypothetical protein